MYYHVFYFGSYNKFLFFIFLFFKLFIYLERKDEKNFFFKSKNKINCYYKKGNINI